MKKRICLFGGYDLKNEIDDYVVYLIKELSKLSDVYYFGDFDCKKSELEKIKPYCKQAYAKRHKKYDFGSWQELVKIIGKEEIRKYDELILTNDSCFGPLFSLDDVFKKMDSKKCDFWGLSSSRGYHIHIQSYFVVFKKNIIDSDILFDFLESVVPEKSLREVCDHYEDRLTYVLSKEGYTFDTFIPYGDFKNQPYYNTTNAIKNAKFPFLKVKTFYGQVGHEPIEDWKKLISDNSEYDINLIANNLYKRGLTDKEIYNYMCAYKKTRKLVKIKKFIYDCIKFVLYPVRKFLHRFVDNKIEAVVNNYNYQLNEINNELHIAKTELFTICNTLNIKSNYLITEFNRDKICIKEEKKHEKKVYHDDKDTFVFRNIANIYNSIGDDKKDILFVGNFDLMNCNDFNFNDNTLIMVNNELIDKKTFISECCHEVRNLENFSVEKNNNLVRFDYIFIQPFSKEIEDEEVFNILKNLKKMMIFETTLFINVRNSEYEKYTEMFEKLDLISDMDAYGLFLDKVTNYGNYQTIFLKKKIK